MIPKEKARDLYNKFYNTNSHQNSINVRHHMAKENASICVDEILIACNEVYDSDMVHFRETGMGEWWLSVKNEIEKI